MGVGACYSWAWSSAAAGSGCGIRHGRKLGSELRELTDESKAGAWVACSHWTCPQSWGLGSVMDRAESEGATLV